MKVSIVTICYNNEKDIRPTIESVLNQTYSNIEYIVIDGASKDDSLKIINEYQDKINKIVSEPDKNLYDAINKGIKMATGDIVGLIHAGDKIHDSDVIKDIADFFERNNPDIIYGHSKIVDEQGKVKRVNKSPEFSKFNMRIGWMPSHQSIYIRRELFEKYGEYRTDIGVTADYEWFIRYFYKDNPKIHKMNRFILYFTLGGVSSKDYSNRIKSDYSKVIKQSWSINNIKPPFAITFFKLAWKVEQFIFALKYKD